MSRLPKMTNIELESSLPQYRSAAEERKALDINSNRLRLSKFEEAEIVGTVAQLIANGEALYVKPPPGQQKLTYEELAQHQLDSGALKDVFVVRKIDGKTQTVCVADLTQRA